MALQVTFLGTASGLPTPGRFGQTVVVGVKKADHDSPMYFVFDAGDGASSLLMRHGIDHLAIEAIFISHMHADHHGGLAQVVKTSMHLQRSRPLCILAPGEGIAPLKAYLAASYLIDPFLKYEINWIPIDEHVGWPIPLAGDAHLTAVANTHLNGYRRRLEQLSKQGSYRFESYSCALDIDSKRLVYTGNLRGASGHDELVSFVEPCDLLITELAHTDPAELGRFLAGRDIAHTAIAHFNRKWDQLSDQELLDLIHQGAGKTGISGHITLTRDGTVITL